MADKNTIIGIEDTVNQVRYISLEESPAALADHEARLKAGTHTVKELQDAYTAAPESIQFRNLGTMGHPDVAVAVRQNMIDAIAAMGTSLTGKAI